MDDIMAQIWFMNFLQTTSTHVQEFGYEHAHFLCWLTMAKATRFIDTKGVLWAKKKDEHKMDERSLVEDWVKIKDKNLWHIELNRTLRENLTQMWKPLTSHY